MSTHIQETDAACRVCAEHCRANPKEPLISMEIPDRPSVKFVVDLFELNNHHYLIMVDYFSKCPEVSKVDNLTAKNVILHVKS